MPIVLKIPLGASSFHYRRFTHAARRVSEGGFLQGHGNHAAGKVAAAIAVILLTGSGDVDGRGCRILLSVSSERQPRVFGNVNERFGTHSKGNESEERSN